MLSNIEKALSDYAEYLKADYEKRSYAKSLDRHLLVEFDIGSKFIKVIVGHMTNGVADTSRSSHSFIVLKSDKFQYGDILKSASWRAPAKNFARGNVLKKDYGTISWCGA